MRQDLEQLERAWLIALELREAIYKHALLRFCLREMRFDQKRVICTFASFYHQKAFKFIKSYKNLSIFFIKYQHRLEWIDGREYFKVIFYV